LLHFIDSAGWVADLSGDPRGLRRFA
jgi:hypothetical protein